MPAANITQAVAGRIPTITPVVDWEAMEGRVGPAPTGGSPAGAAAPVGPGPAMDHPRTVTIAVAVTWPHMPPPRSVRLLRTGTIASQGGAVARLATPQPIPLSEPLPLLLRYAAPGFDSFDPVPRIHWELTSGSFFLPSVGPPLEVGGWLTGGWVRGAYEFIVTPSEGSTRTLSFLLRG